jgi:hypothetical protein
LPRVDHAAIARRIISATGVRGGLVVHVGYGDGRLTAALRASDSYLVHGLDHDAANVAEARAHVASRGLCGPVSVERLSGPRLPYADNLVKWGIHFTQVAPTPCGSASCRLSRPW